MKAQPRIRRSSVASVGRRQLVACAVGLWILLTPPSAVLAEFVQIEPVAAQLAEGMAEFLDGKSVVVASRPAPQTSFPWAVHEAVAVEVTAALCRQGVDAVRSASHPATESLSSGTARFTAGDARRIRAAGRDVLLGITVFSKPARVQAVLWSSNRRSPLNQIGLNLPSECFDLEANVPEFNRQVVAFCRDNFGEAVGDGICATLAGEGLKSAGAKRTGIYTWGRELDAYEPILPGDILQLELAKLTGPEFSRTYNHHTVVVEEVRPDAIVVLHQNVPPLGKVVQREVWPSSANRTGIIQGYRPWPGESPLPPVSPRRRKPPRIVRRGRSIDLLETLDPRLDSVRGIWFRDGGLKWNRDTYARLQVPVEPPERYTLRLKVRRLYGRDQFGIGLIVGGHQVLLPIDAYGGNKTGLHLLDGKKARDNETTYTGSVLPMNKLVDLAVQVRPDSVRLAVDGLTILDWSGDPARLSMDELFSVPRTDWLFLAAWNTHCEVAEFFLDSD